MVLPKMEPGTDTDQSNAPVTTIPLSVLTGDPNQNQLVAVNANGQVVHVGEQSFNNLKAFKEIVPTLY